MTLQGKIYKKISKSTLNCQIGKDANLPFSKLKLNYTLRNFLQSNSHYFKKLRKKNYFNALCTTLAEFPMSFRYSLL